MVPVIAKEGNFILPSEFQAEDWTPFRIHEKSLRIIAATSGLIFVGPELNRKEEYINTAIKYTVETMAAARAYKAATPLSQWLYGSSLPEVKALKRREEDFRRQLMEVVQKRRESQLNGEKMPNDLLQAGIEECKTRGLDDNAILEWQLGLTLAATHSSAQLMTNV